MTIADMVYSQVKLLPDPLAREVLDFVGFLREGRDRAQWRDLMSAQATGLAAVWDNPEDKVWDDEWRKNMDEEEKKLLRAQMEFEHWLRIKQRINDGQATLASNELRIRDLSGQLATQTASLGREQEMLSVGRDVRDVMGARNLFWCARCQAS